MECLPDASHGAEITGLTPILSSDGGHVSASVSGLGPKFCRIGIAMFFQAKHAESRPTGFSEEAPFCMEKPNGKRKNADLVWGVPWTNGNSDLDPMELNGR